MIDKIKVQNIRGISTETIVELNGKSLAIFGENGKGKSSLIDGIEYAITGDIGRISKGVQEISLKRHAPNLGRKDNEMNAVVEFSDNSCSTNGEYSREDSLASSFISQFVTDIHILRRTQLLDSIAAKPKDRYDLLKPFLPLDKITDYEDKIKEAIAALKRKKEDAKDKVSSTRSSLGKLIESTDFENIKKENVILFINQKLKALDVDLIEKISELKELDKKLSALLSTDQKALNEKNRNDIITSLDNVKEYKTIISSFLSFAKKVKEEISLNDKKNIIAYERLLKDGLKILEEETEPVCPLCLSDILLEETIKSIKNRIEENKRITEVKSKFLDDISTIKKQVNGIEFELRVMQKSNQNIENTYVSNVISAIFKDLNLLNIWLDKPMSDILLTTIDIPVSRTVEENIQLAIESLKIDKSEKTFQQQQKSILEVKELVDKLVTTIGNLNKNIKNEKEITKAYKKIETYYNEMVSQRKRYVQNIYNEIEQDINHFYNMIHPEENIGDLRLVLKDSKSGSTQLQSKFYDNSDQDPRAFYSESHLDTLGLCIFLAVFKRQVSINNDCRLLILDDVFTSVDAPHRRKMINVIFKELKEYQVIITTHDRVLYNELIELQRALNVNGNYINLEIFDWDISNGMILDDYVSNIQRVKGIYGEPRSYKSQLASSAGIHLEFLLSKLRFSMNLSIPARLGDKYTIGDIWPKLHSELKKNATFNKTHEKILEEIQTSVFIRNATGGHYNEWAEDLSKEEVKAFVNAIIRLNDTVYCEKCGNFILKSNEGYSCKCGDLSYTKKVS